MQEQMKNKILYTDEARCDLDSIWDYIALDLQNQQAAERLVNKIMDRVDQLEDFAESGMLLSSISEVIGEERFLVCENYLIFYHTGKSVVTVDRVLYGRRDYLSVLFDKTREEIAATLAFSAIQNNDKIGVIFFSDRIEKYIPPKKESEQHIHSHSS